MKNLELLNFLTREQIEKIKLSEQNYLRFARIYFSIVSFENSELIVKVWQRENKAGKYLTAKELIDRAKGVFADIDSEINIHFRPIPFKTDTLENVDTDWINNKIEQLGLKQRDIVKLLNIDKGSLSRLLSGENLTKSSKAMFYYLFKYLEVK